MNASVDITNYLPFLATLLGGGVAVTIIAQVIKKLFGLSSGHVIHLMVVAVTVLAAAAQYVIQAHAKLPVAVLGVSGATIYGVSQFVYNEAGYIKPLLGRVQVSVAPAAQAVTAGEAPTQPATAEVAPVAPTDAVPAEPASNSGEFNA